jgi:hypothetical protein
MQSPAEQLSSPVMVWNAEISEECHEPWDRFESGFG